MIMVSTDYIVGANNLGKSDCASSVTEAANWFDLTCDLRFYNIRAEGKFVNLYCEGSTAIGTAITNSYEESKDLEEEILSIKNKRINANGQ